MTEPLHISYDMINIDMSHDDSIQEETVPHLQRKILKLSNARLQDKEKIDSLIHENELLKLVIDEKERSVLKWHTEFDILQQKLCSEKLKNELKNKDKSTEKIPSSTNIKLPVERRAISMSSASFLLSKNVNSTETGNKSLEDEEIVNKLSEEVQYLKRQHQLLTEKLRNSEDKIVEQRNSLLEQELKNKRLDNEINKQKELIAQLKRAVDNGARLNKELERSREKISELEKILFEAENNNNELLLLIQSKTQSIMELEELAILTKNQSNEYYNSLTCQITENERLKQNCQMFRLKRIGNLGSLIVIPTLLLIRRGLKGNYIIELENYFSKLVLDAQDIIELSLCKDNPNKFYMLYRIRREEGIVNEREEYESEDSPNEICREMKEFLEKADIFDKEAIKEERAAHNSRKGFFSDLVLFFS